MAKKLNAVVGQSGGPTSVINQSLVGVIEEVRKHSHIDKLLGCRHGVRGIVNNDYIQLNDVPADLLEKIAGTPSSALGSSRDKPDAEYCRKIMKNFKENNVGYFFYIGGNDSADAARIVQEMAAAEGHELHVFHIPKTIDNDLKVHDHTPGFGSAAKFVASAIMGDNYDNASLPGIKVDVIMGRHAGFLTAASVLARQYDGDGPHLIYVPEAPMSEDKFLADVDRIYSKKGRCLIAVSEGISTPDGKTWAEKMSGDLEKDSHGNVQLSGTGALGDYLANLVTKKLNNPGGKKLRVRADTFGYLQRSFAGYVSETDAKEAREVARQAVRYSTDPSKLEGSVVMKRVSNSPYKIELDWTSIKNVARETKHLSAEYIKDGNDITQAFIDYAKPLVGALPVVGTFAEMRK
ncbi:MAG: 6-phosphofructokinase [Burkholderiales bacterium]|nr:6-phosphofructokinase [Phycisphaerae bacterium]